MRNLARRELDLYDLGLHLRRITDSGTRSPQHPSFRQNRRQNRPDNHQHLQCCQNFFDCHSKVQAEEFTKVNAVYFDSDIDAQAFIEKMALHENYVPIELTEYTKYNWSKPNEIYRRRISNCSKNQFEVIFNVAYFI